MNNDPSKRILSPGRAAALGVAAAGVLASGVAVGTHQADPKARTEEASGQTFVNNAIDAEGHTHRVRPGEPAEPPATATYGQTPSSVFNQGPIASPIANLGIPTVAETAPHFPPTGPGVPAEGSQNPVTSDPGEPPSGQELNIRPSGPAPILGPEDPAKHSDTPLSNGPEALPTSFGPGQ
jgi:hypothetical protein